MAESLGATENEFDELVSSVTNPGPSSTRSERSVVGSVLWALAAVPSLTLGLLFSMVLRVRIQDGAWPARNQPDPKDLGFHNTITILGIVASVAVVVVVPLLALAAFFLKQRPVPYRAPIVAVVGFAILLLVMSTGLGDWIGD